MATLFSNLPGMAYRATNDSSWTMEFVSGGCLDLTGYEPETLISNKVMTFEAIIEPETTAGSLSATSLTGAHAISRQGRALRAHLPHPHERRPHQVGLGAPRRGGSEARAARATPSRGS